MIKLISIISVCMSAQVWAASPPWYYYHSMIKAAFAKDKCVQVGELVNRGEEWELTITGCNEKKANGLNVVLKNEIEELIHLKVVGGSASPLSTTSVIETLLQDAFVGNGYFEKLHNRGALGTQLTLEFKPEVIQFFSDNIADLYLQSRFVAQDIFERLIKRTIDGKAIGFTTTP